MQGQIEWWKKSVIYQIYPKSFNDTTNNGFGDIQGIINKLDYIKELGVDVIWLSPIFESPNKDNGYDISNYKKIDSRFGTNDDLQELVIQAHKKGIKVLMDLVVNHTSNQHKWFQNALKDKDSQYRDYYFFRKGNNGKPPNDWESIFGGSVWKYNEYTDDYYLHYFADFQPDLNWDNPQVRKEVFDIVRFWMDKGVDGWRLDAIVYISKPIIPQFESNNKKYIGMPKGDNLHDYIKMLCSVMREYKDPLIMGECAEVEWSDLWKFTAPERQELSMTILFDLLNVDLDYSKGCGKYAIKDLDVRDLKRIVKGWHENLKNGYIVNHIQSHDQPRILSRWGNESKRKASAKMLGTFNMLMRGTPIIYQGEEIGMQNWDFTFEQMDDIDVINHYKEYVIEKKIYTKEQFMKIAHYVSRDNSRTPMQWNKTYNGGFTNGTPWLPVNNCTCDVNVDDNLKDKSSIFYHYQQLVKLRRENKLFQIGDIEVLVQDNKDIIAYKRQLKDEQQYSLIVCNFQEKEVCIRKDELQFQLFNWQLVLSNYDDLIQKNDNIILRSYESFVLLTL